MRAIVSTPFISPPPVPHRKRASCSRHTGGGQCWTPVPLTSGLKLHAGSHSGRRRGGPHALAPHIRLSGNGSSVPRREATRPSTAIGTSSSWTYAGRRNKRRRRPPARTSPTSRRCERRSTLGRTCPAIPCACSPATTTVRTGARRAGRALWASRRPTTGLRRHRGDPDRVAAGARRAARPRRCAGGGARRDRGACDQRAAVERGRREAEIGRSRSDLASGNEPKVPTAVISNA